LKRHAERAHRFVATVLASDYASEQASNYRRRIRKNRDKLFVFLEHDGIPWNNNNAEHAIKRFAFLRHIIGGCSTEKGIKEYLVLLSICETIRLRGLSFLRFLASGCTDIDQFASSEGRRVAGQIQR
jgi:hypothetical protein